MELYDVVELTADRPEDGLVAGSVGTVVHIFQKPNLAYEVEFADGNGKTIAMVALTPDQLRPRP
jgi:hypothetical protein